MKRNKYTWTQELEERLINIYPNTHTQSIADEFNMSIYAIRNKAHALGLKKDIEWVRENSRENIKTNEAAKKAWIKKGTVPHNKGKKMSKELYEKSKHTFFKKGNVPANAKEDYTEVKRKDSKGNEYWMIKVPERTKLMYKHIYIWELNKGIVPKGFNVVFKNGNSLDCHFENLECISNKELMERNTIHRYPEEVKTAIRLSSRIKKELNSQEDGK